MFLRKRWFASRPGVSLLGTHKKASTRERFWSNWSQTEKVRRIQQCSSFKNPLPRYLPGKMMTDVALNIHFKVDKHFLTKCFGNICDQPMNKYITWFPITLTHQKENVWFVQLFGQTISGVKLFHGCNPGLLKVPQIFKTDKTKYRVIRAPEQLTHVLPEKFFFSLNYDRESLKTNQAATAKQKDSPLSWSILASPDNWIQLKRNFESKPILDSCKLSNSTKELFYCLNFLQIISLRSTLGKFEDGAVNHI